MNIVKIICIVIGLVLDMIGIIMIYDARKLTKKWFGFNDQNEGSKGFKLVGFSLAIIGILIIYFSL